MTVEAENFVEQLLTESVHHRHHNDEGRDAEHDAEKGEPGNHRDESFLASRAQITQRKRPFERGKGPRPVGLAHDGSRVRLFTQFWRIRAKGARAKPLATHRIFDSEVPPVCASRGLRGPASMQACKGKAWRQYQTSASAGQAPPSGSDFPGCHQRAF